MIDIFTSEVISSEDMEISSEDMDTSEDMENMSLRISQYLTLYFLINGSNLTKNV